MNLDTSPCRVSPRESEALLFRPCVTLFLGALFALLFAPGSLSAQEPTPDNQIRCPPVRSADAIIARVDSIAAMASSARIDPRPQAIWDAAEFPFTATSPCPRFAPEADLRDEAGKLLTHAIQSENPMVAIAVMNGLFVAYALVDELGLPPIDLIVNAVASGRTDEARGTALTLLIQWSADHPAARDAVLHLGRAEIGPPAWPELPSELFSWVRNSPHDYEEALGQALAAEPALLRNPRARWMAECGERASAFQGRFTSPEERQDPCHPANMPPARPGGG